MAMPNIEKEFDSSTNTNVEKVFDSNFMYDQNNLKLHLHPILVMAYFCSYMKKILLQGCKMLPLPLLVILLVLFIRAIWIVSVSDFFAYIAKWLNPDPIFGSVIEFLSYSVFWLTMGILSSIGFGTGIPTGALYAFPLIVKTSVKNSPNNILMTCAQLYYPIGIWALGTAFGEIPPYYMARTTRLGKKDANNLNIDMDMNMNINMNINMSNNNNDSDKNKKCCSYWTICTRCANSMQRIMTTFIKKWGFWGILFFASYPNAMFDLCGVISGYYLIPFNVFLSATIIGKVFVKTNVQLHFLVMITYGYVDRIRNYLPSPLQFLLDIVKSPEQEHTNLTSFASIWQLIVICVTLYFLVQFIDAIAQNEYAIQKTSANEKNRKKN